MPVTLEELESFHQYASGRLKDGTAAPSLDELFMEWADRRDRSTINDAIRRGLADVDAGRYEPAADAMRKIRHEFGLPQE